MAPSIHYYRIRNVPSSWPKSTLLQALKAAHNAFAASVEAHISLYPEPSAASQTAILQYNGPLTCLDQNGVYRVNRNDCALELDNHFHGLTPLHTAGPDAAVDFVAVVGLDGHAYNSWMSPMSWRMWLRDTLPARAELQNSRVLTYGYDTHLTSGKSWDEYRKEFLRELAGARAGTEAQTRPLVFVAHNIGGVLVMQALLECLKNSEYSHILASVTGVVFVGTPHQGMQTEGLIAAAQSSSMTAGQKASRTEMLQQLSVGSPFLKKMAAGVQGVLKSMSVFTVYETRGALNAKGMEVFMVDRSSACLHGQGYIVGFVARNNEDLIRFVKGTEADLATLLDYLEKAMQPKRIASSSNGSQNSIINSAVGAIAQTILVRNIIDIYNLQRYMQG